jgi:hypothetical protein
VWPIGGEADNYEPLPDNNIRFVGLYSGNLITYFTNVQDPFDPQYIDQTISYTGMGGNAAIYEQIVAISDNMEYIYAVARSTSSTQYSFYRGTDSGLGLNFTQMFDVDNNVVTKISMSKDGQHVYALAENVGGGVSNLKISSDYGQTFGNNIVFNDTNNPNDLVDYVACSMGGKYVYAVYNAPFNQNIIRVYKSDDYGSSFSDISAVTGLIRGNSQSLYFFPIVSGNGQYVYFAVSYVVTTSLPSGTFITMSDNFGTSFFECPTDIRGTGTTYSQTDKYGKYLILSNAGSNQKGLVSTNYASTVQNPNLTLFTFGIGATSLSNFGTVGLMERVTRLTTSTPNQEIATSVNSLQSFSETGIYNFTSQNYGPIQKVVNIQ